GTESPSTAWPDGKRTQAAFTPTDFPDPDMTEAADQLAADYGITRDQQESYAVQSHHRALAHPSERLVGVHRDDGPRDAEKLVNRLGTITHHPRATVTGLSAARIADAAAAVQLAPENDQPHLAIEVVDHRLVGADPALRGIGEAPAYEALLSAVDYCALYVDGAYI